MKAISTKFYGPTNRRGARIVAFDADNNRVSISYPYELSAERGHQQAALALCKKLNWRGQLVQGATNTGYVFVWKYDAALLQVD